MMIESVAQNVNIGRLRLSSDNQATSPMTHQVRGQGIEPVSYSTAGLYTNLYTDLPKRIPATPGQGSDQAGHFTGTQRQSMVGHSAGDARRAFDNIQTIHARS